MNKTFIKIIILIVLISTDAILSQTNDTTYIYGDSLKSNNIQIFDKWDYHPGDDSSWAQPTFSSAGWQLTDCRVRRISDSVQANNWSGIGWFRKTIVIDSSLMNKTVGMTLNHYGASEFYINGKLFNIFGKVSENNKTEKIYYSNSKPLIIHFDSGSSYLFAVKYSNHLPMDYPYLYYRFRGTLGFFATFKSLDEALSFYGITQSNMTSLAAWFIGIFLSISVIYFLLFLFYSKQREYLYYTIFTFTIALSFLNTVLDNIVSSNLLYFLGFTVIFRSIVLAVFLSVLAFIYQIFYGRMLKLFRYLFAIGIGAYILQLITGYDDTARYIYFAIVFVCSIEILRVVYLAIKRKKDNAWVIGAGVSVFVAGVLIILISVLTSGQFDSDYILFILLFSIPLSMSIYLARSSSQTNKNLEIQLANVKTLSEQNLLKEKEKQQILANQNELLEHQVNERTSELNQSLINLKSAQAQLVHSEKMASLGELTAGIAHEIKNPLNFVNNFSEVSNELVEEMKEELQNGNKDEALEIIEGLRQNLEKINQHGKRADSIVKGMLLHSRGTSGEKTLTDINDLLDQYVNLAYHGMKAQNKEFNITIEKDFDETLEKINVVPQDISRVFLNIINNACYATYEKKKKSSDNNFSPTLKVSTKNLNGKVEIRIGDNGNGIPKDIIDKIFQPFFTTKPTGEGTGLGLSLSYDIVTKLHGGDLKVDTKEGQGTQFIILLPFDNNGNS